MAEAAITARNLRKEFGSVVAVNSIDFTVPRGSITALLGGNGAGKTTTIGMLLGVLLPTAGQITVLGEDMLRHRYRVLPRMNFSSPYVDLPGRLTVRQNLTVYGEIYGVQRLAARIVELTNDLQIAPLLDRHYGALSAGQKTRVALAKALINHPDLLLLDEPTASLDPDIADWVRGYLHDYQRVTGATILLASHHMAEVERLCDRVIIMRGGSIAATGSPEELRAAYGRANLEEVFLDIARDRTNAA